MRNSIIWKMIFAFAIIALITAGLVVLFIRLTTVDRFSQLIVEQERTTFTELVLNYYTNAGSWNGVYEYIKQVRVVTNRPADEVGNINEPRPPEFPRPFFNQRNKFALVDSQGSVIIPAQPDYSSGMTVLQKDLKKGQELIVDDQVVGYVLTITQPEPPNFNPMETRYLKKTNEALGYAIFGALIFALVMGIFLAKNLIHPLKELTLAAQNMSQGQLEQRVNVGSKDEIGQLAESFNKMSEEISLSNRLRRQMTADIAHDLRTPLTVIGGYIESMRDGILQPTSERFDLIYTEIERLQNLVSDLRMLSQVDAGELKLNLQSLQPKIILERAAAPHLHQADKNQISLKVEVEEELPDIRVDEDRMMQVLDNLISNSMRYTPAGGEIILGAVRMNGGVQLAVRDNGSGIPAEDLPHIFERFYRAEKSRETGSDESGLGLAIAKALVEAQGGKISAESTLNVGTVIHIEFLQS
jgi:signal transduction histidine kinase